MTSKRGGKREGSGRKPTGTDRTEILTVRVSPNEKAQLKAKLNELRNQTK